MERLLVRARERDFAKLVLENSEDRTSRKQGRILLARKRAVRARVQGCRFSSRPTRSAMSRLRSGLHILKLIERVPARKVDFAKAAPDIKEHLLQQELQKASRTLRRVKQNASVQISTPLHLESPRHSAPTPQVAASAPLTRPQRRGPSPHRREGEDEGSRRRRASWEEGFLNFGSWTFAGRRICRLDL